MDFSTEILRNTVYSVTKDFIKPPSQVQGRLLGVVVYEFRYKENQIPLSPMDLKLKTPSNYKRP